MITTIASPCEGQKCGLIHRAIMHNAYLLAESFDERYPDDIYYGLVDTMSIGNRLEKFILLPAGLFIQDVLCWIARRVCICQPAKGDPF